MPVRDAYARDLGRPSSPASSLGRSPVAKRFGIMGLTLVCGAWMVLLSPKAISGLPTANTLKHPGQPEAISPVSSAAKAVLANSSETVLTEVPAVAVPLGLRIAPAQAEMAVGKTQNFRLVDQNGHTVRGAAWMVSDFTVAELDSVEPARIAAIAPGQATVTAMLGDQAVRASLTVVKPSATISSDGRATGQTPAGR